MRPVLIASCLMLARLPLAEETKEIHPHTFQQSVDGETYTINFNNISIIEYIRFVSKAANINFIFDERELEFNVTVVSEEPVNASNIVSALIQVLRMHDLILLEQENNLIITKSKKVNALPTVVSGDHPDSFKTNAPIVTRVFRIHNANLNAIAGIIRPMISDSALVEVSNETRQLIVTDITTNVEKIAELLESIDAPHSPLEIDSYQAKHTPLDELITLTTKIVDPFTEGNPLIFVPQPEASTIFLVSTPSLIDRALTVLEDLDVPNKQVPTNATFFLYMIQNRPAAELSKSLWEFADQLESSPSPPLQLISTLRSSKYVRESNSLLFFGDEVTISKVKDLLTNLDSTYTTGIELSFYIYRIRNANPDHLIQTLNGIAEKLGQVEFPDEELINTIGSMKWIRETNSLVFTGTPHGIKQITQLLETIDTAMVPPPKPPAPPPPPAIKETHAFYLYKLENAQGDRVLEQLRRIAGNLQEAQVTDDSLIETLNSVRWIKESNSLLITGTKESVEETKTIISHFDTSKGKTVFKRKTSFFIYKPQHRSAKEIQAELTDMAEDLQSSDLIDPDLYLAITTMRYVATSGTILFTGPEDSIDQVKDLLVNIDVAKPGGPIQKLGSLTFFIYKPKYISPVQLMTSLKKFGSDLARSNTEDKELVRTLEGTRYVKETGSLLFTGPSETLKRVEQLIEKFDIPAMSPAAEGKPPAEPSVFAIYKPKYQTGEELILVLCEFEQNLASSGIVDDELFSTINNLKWIEKTSSLLISGAEPAVRKVEELLLRFDQPSKEGLTPTIESIDNTSFLVYKLQYQPGSSIQTALKQISTDLASTQQGGANKALLDAINSIQWIQVTNSLLATGEQSTLTKMKELIGSLDVPLKQVYIEVLVVRTSVTNAQNFGLQWGGQIQYLSKTAGGITNIPGINNFAGTSASDAFATALQPISATTTPVAANLPLFNSGFDLGVIGDIIMHKGKSFISLGSLIQALQTDNDSAVVFNPKMITQDNNNSTIFVGSNIPYIGSQVTINTGGTANNTNVTSLEYINVGFNLSLTPTLGNGDIVTLDITTNISSVSNSNVNGNQGTTNGIQTDQTNMSTRVHVPNEHFVILSGMINESSTHFRSSIPCLGGLPVIGLAFSENDRLKSQSNLIFFLRPHIINSFEEYKALTDGQEERFKASAGLPILREEIDDFIDLVKTPENE